MEKRGLNGNNNCGEKEIFTKRETMNEDNYLNKKGMKRVLPPSKRKGSK